MLTAQLCGSAGNPPRDRFNGYGDPVDELLHDRHSASSVPVRPDQNLCVDAGRNYEAIALDRAEGGDSASVVRISGIQEGDEDARIEDA